MLGAVLAKTPSAWLRMQALRWPALAIALAAWALQLALAPAVAGTIAAWLGPLAHSTLQWCAIVAVLGFAHRHLNRDGALRRYLTGAVFPVYILHQTLIIGLARAIAPADLAPATEAPLLVIATFALSFAGFELVRRLRWLRPWFGLSAGMPTSRPAGADRVSPRAPEMS